MPRWRDAGLAGLVALGAWVSFHYAYAAWNVESDLATPAVVWAEWGRHGWAALREWRYYHANWLFSVILPFFAVFSAFESAPGVVLAAGWGIFVGCCAATWYILRPTLGGRGAAAAAGLLLFAGHATISGMGYLTYAVSHNASTLFSLAALACLLGWLDGGRLWRLPTASGLLFAAAMSDPWTVAALGVPLLLAAGLTWALGHRAAWRRRLAICACTAAVLAAVQTRAFGLLIMLPRSHYAFGTLDTAREHALLAAQYAAVLFNVVPGADAPWSYVPHLPAMAGTCGIVLLAVGYSIAGGAAAPVADHAGAVPGGRRAVVGGGAAGRVRALGRAGRSGDGAVFRDPLLPAARARALDHAARHRSPVHRGWSGAGSHGAGCSC